MNKTVIYRYYVYRPTTGEVLDHNNTFTQNSQFVRVFNTEIAAQNVIKRFKNQEDYKDETFKINILTINF